MSWINSLFNRNKTETIEVELLDETDKSIKIKYGIHTTYLPKKIITFDRVNTDRIIKVRLPLWLQMNRIITTEITGLVLLLIIGVGFGILSLWKKEKSKNKG